MTYLKTIRRIHMLIMGIKGLMPSLISHKKRQPCTYLRCHKCFSSHSHKACPPSGSLPWWRFSQRSSWHPCWRSRAWPYSCSLDWQYFSLVRRARCSLACSGRFWTWLWTRRSRIRASNASSSYHHSQIRLKRQKHRPNKNSLRLED